MIQKEMNKFVTENDIVIVIVELKNTSGDNYPDTYICTEHFYGRDLDESDHIELMENRVDVKQKDWLSYTIIR